MNLTIGGRVATARDLAVQSDYGDMSGSFTLDTTFHAPLVGSKVVISGGPSPVVGRISSTHFNGTTNTTKVTFDSTAPGWSTTTGGEWWPAEPDDPDMSDWDWMDIVDYYAKDLARRRPA